jgi:hypothetical protein
MITINGKNIFGKNINISNGKVIINGVDMTPDSKEITINVMGDIDTLDVDYAKEIKVNGNINKANTGSADITCVNITGGARTGSGDVECETINGDVQTGSGDVKSNTITGSVKTGSGDIKYRK